MTKTPRTDAQLTYDEDDPVSADFARQLETELADLTQAHQDVLNILQSVRAERDKYENALRAIKEAPGGGPAKRIAIQALP